MSPSLCYNAKAKFWDSTHSTSFYEVTVINIYKESFFYDVILHAEKDLLAEIIEEKSKFYTQRSIPKKSGIRILNCLAKESELYRLQSRLSKYFFQNIPIPDGIYGFVKGASYRDFLLPHRNTGKSDRYYLRIDIDSFFDSITTKLLNETLSYYFKTTDEVSNSTLLKNTVDLLTLNDALPQGAVTSPVVSNIVFRQLDLRIKRYCDKLNITYTRYADDMLFSSESKFLNEDYFMKKIYWILKSKNFKINYSKIRKSINEISLNGFVVGENIRISRKKKSDISNALFLFQSGGQPKNIKQYIDRLNLANLNYRVSKFDNKSSVINYLTGYRSFLIDWIPENDEEYYEVICNMIGRIENLILSVDKLN